MKFIAREWRKYYDAIQSCGQILKDASVWIDESGVTHKPICPISFDERKNIKKEIIKLKENQRNYLNSCGLTMPKPLWRFDIKDESTWVSDPSFRFKHLIANKGKKRK